MSTYILDFPRPDEWISANERTHWAIKAAKTKAWREATATHARAARIPQLSCVHITAEIRSATTRRRDAANLAPTVKAAIDGLVDAGVLPDDSDTYVAGVTFCRGKKADKVARLRLIIEELS